MFAQAPFNFISMNLRLKSSIRIALIYFTIGLLWISLSDYAAAYVSPKDYPADFLSYQLVKGAFYVLFTSVLLYILIENHSRRMRHKIEEARQLNQQLERYARDLEHSNEELQQFSYITSHDLQEPLRNITSFLKRLEQKCAGSMDHKARRYVHHAITASDRMRRLIRDALTLHQVREQHHPELEAVKLHYAVQESLLLLRRQIDRKQACVIIKPLPVLLTNESLIIQLFHVLIGNSLIYQREEIPPLVEIFPEEHKHHWNIFIRDNGIGISEKHKEKIFLAFRRLHAQDEYTESGTGVGLAMARKILQLLGGSISLAIHPPGEPGCTFCFSLPKDLPEKQQKEDSA